MSIVKCGGVLGDQVIESSHIVRAALSSVCWVGEDEAVCWRLFNLTI